MDGGDRVKPRLGKRQGSLAGGERANVRKARSGNRTGASRHGTDASSARGNTAERPFIGHSGATATRAPRSGGSPTRSRCLSRWDMPLQKIGLVPVLEDAAMVRMPRVRRDATVGRARKCTDGVEVNATANAMVAGRARAEKFEL